MAKEILFLCGHNAGRSQMAQAFFNHLNTNPEYIGLSAGTNIAAKVNPVCIQAMVEIGIDMGNTSIYYPKKFDEEKKYFRIYSMGCGAEICATINQDLGILDPAGKNIDEVRLIREEIRKKIEKIAGEFNG